MIDKQFLGSQTAKNGFMNEKDIINLFNDWREEELSRQWLTTMGYILEEIEEVYAYLVKGNFKSDIQVQVSIKLKEVLDCQNISIKLVSNTKGFNQIDKRYVKAYQELWNISEEVVSLLQYYTGEKPPYKSEVRDKRRMYLNELSKEEQEAILNFFNLNKTLIVSDILKGRGKFSAEWMLVIQKIEEKDILNWSLKPMNYCLNFFGNGEIILTKKGNLKIGKITVQRKGGDGGRKTACMLQFKIDPSLLIDKDYSKYQ